MDAYLSKPDDFSYSSRPPVLLAASSDAAMARAERTIEDSGLRVGARLPIECAFDRVQQQARATAVWVELDGDGGAPMDELLAGLGRDVACGRYGAAVSATGAPLDPLAARLVDSAVELIVDAGEAERVAALAIATAASVHPVRISDIASDQNAERLRQLSEEVSRIASTLDRLSAGPETAPLQPTAVLSDDIPSASAETVRSVIRARRLRARYFSRRRYNRFR